VANLKSLYKLQQIRSVPNSHIALRIWAYTDDHDTLAHWATSALRLLLYPRDGGDNFRHLQLWQSPTEHKGLSVAYNLYDTALPYSLQCSSKKVPPLRNTLIHYVGKTLGFNVKTGGTYNYHCAPFGRTMALGSTLPLTEISTRNISWGVKTAGA
jgi:hypothetical protein